MESLFEVHHRLIGKENQKIIQASNVTIVGVGGLGCAVAENVVRLGVANVVLIDSGKIKTSNLPRQPLFNENEVGQYKVQIAREKLSKFSSNTKIRIELDTFTSTNGKPMLKQSDVVIDCTDNFTSRYAISKIAKALNIPMIYGGVNGFEGQIGVFNYQGSKSFHEAFPNFEHLLESDNCKASGVLPFVVQIVGAMQVAEFYKICLDQNNVCNNILRCINILTGNQRFITL